MHLSILPQIIVELSPIFQTFIEKKSTENKLSFSFTTRSNSTEIKKRISNMNEIKISKKRKKTTSELIPASFLLLLDELCIASVAHGEIYDYHTRGFYLWLNFKTTKVNKIKKNFRRILQ